MSGCIFCEIIAGRAPASVVHRDDRCIAFMDIHPVTPGHLLVVPLTHAADLAALEVSDGAHLFQVAHSLTAALRKSGLRAEGVTLFLADGAAAGQEIFHTHLHVIPRFAGDGFRMSFAPDYGTPVARTALDGHAAAVRTGVGTV